MYDINLKGIRNCEGSEWNLNLVSWDWGWFGLLVRWWGVFLLLIFWGKFYYIRIFEKKC